MVAGEFTSHATQVPLKLHARFLVTTKQKGAVKYPTDKYPSTV